MVMAKGGVTELVVLEEAEEVYYVTSGDITQYYGILCCEGSFIGGYGLDKTNDLEN